MADTIVVTDVQNVQNVQDVQNIQDVQDVQKKMTPSARYYLLHREEKNAKTLARYHNNPEVIAKKEERERKKIEKDAEKASQKLQEKEQKAIEKARVRQEKIAIALATSKKFNP